MTFIKNRFPLILIILAVLFIGCEKDEETITPGTEPPEQPSISQIFVSTDKARYNPGEEVNFSIDVMPANTTVRYKHLNEIIHEESLSGDSWSWSPPANDFRGYLIELLNDENEVLGTVGVDVSSDWTKFPRYGFLSKFGDLSKNEMQQIIENLNTYHINGLQFYDWHYKPHAPLAIENGSPMPVWRDIINREIYLKTVEEYIDLAHQNNMKAMYYNLAYGVLDDYPNFNIQEEWFLYNDQDNNRKDRHELSEPFISNIYLTVPSNPGWLDYYKEQQSLVYEHLNFDGFHIDQLGNRGQVYDYEGNSVSLPETFEVFLDEMNQVTPEKHLVMNAVDQFAQENISQQAVDFLYTEVWSANSYSDLANVILQNNDLSNSEKQTVLAAYMNYDLANNTGQFNTPGVLLTDAVIFAFGGAHLELGEHMLGKEYFPNNNLAMSPDLQERLRKYYDFLTAYENLLRDGGTWSSTSVNTGDGKAEFNSWPPQASKVAVASKSFEKQKVLHFLNFSQATTMNWRDNEGRQAPPNPLTNLLINIDDPQNVTNIWYASPDFEGGATRDLEFTRQNGKLLVRVPYLEYWGMMVLEYN